MKYIIMAYLITYPSVFIEFNPPANAGDSRDLGSIPRLGRFPGVGNGNPLQYTCLMGAWQAIVYRVAKSQT